MFLLPLPTKCPYPIPKRRDERKRLEEAQARAVSELEAREKRLMEEAKLEKEAQRKAYDKQARGQGRGGGNCK